MKLKARIEIKSRDVSVAVDISELSNIWSLMSVVEQLVETNTGVTNLLSTSGQWVKFVSHLMDYGRATYFDFTGTTPRVEVTIAVG